MKIPRSNRLFSLLCSTALLLFSAQSSELPKIGISTDAPRFEIDGKPFVPFGINYYRPGTGWAPQVWKQFDAEATRRDFRRMKDLGVNCVRVFLSYGSFSSRAGLLDQTGLDKFDQFLAIAEEFQIYVHPTGLDHWEGTPDWAKVDRIADERTLKGLEDFWEAFAARYRGRNVIFAYDLRNEPEVAWDTLPMREKWNRWLKKRYPTADSLRRALENPNLPLDHENIPVPDPKKSAERELSEYQLFREEIADEWTRRQVAAIKAADPDALVTVGLIQWSVPSLLPSVPHYSGFRPERQARLLDFLEVHFYPLVSGAYEYKDEEDELRNLAYLEGVVREVARPGKPVVIGEFGWYGGGKPKFDQGRHPAASEDQQARWCGRVVETTAGLAIGWLNWGFYDQPEATDVSELTGLLTADGKVKAWGREFQSLSKRYAAKTFQPPPTKVLPHLDWDRATVNLGVGHDFRELYYQARKNELRSAHASSEPRKSSFLSSADTRKVRVAPRQTEEIFANPGMGWQTFHRFADDDKNLQGLPSGSAYFRFYWREIEPHLGQIDFARFDDLLKHARQAGQKLAFRVMCTGSGEYMDVPAWLKEIGSKGVEFTFENRKHWLPLFSDPIFHQHHLRLIRELGNRYNGHPDLDLVDIGSVGLWGEWHMSGTAEVQTGKAVDLPSIELQREIIQAWSQAFSRTPKVVLIGSVEGMTLTKQMGLGWRADCLGDMGGFSKGWNHMENFYLQQIEKTGASEAWQKAPVAFESCWDMRKWQDAGWNIPNIFDYALALHASYINNKSAPLPEETRPEVERLLRKLGYRLVIESIEHDSGIAPGKSLDLDIHWKNLGVAPPYLDYRVAARLQQKTGEQKPIFSTTKSSVRGWLPGDHKTPIRIALPNNTAPGTYKVSIAVVEPGTHNPALRLATEGRDAEGWHLVSQIEVNP